MITPIQKPRSPVRPQMWSRRKSDPQAYLSMQNGKIDAKMSKTDPALKTRNWSRLVSEISVVIQAWFFIIPGYFTLRFYRSNYFYSSSEEDIELTIVCGKVIEACTQHVNTAWRPSKNWNNEFAGGCIGVLLVNWMAYDYIYISRVIYLPIYKLLQSQWCTNIHNNSSKILVFYQYGA